MAKAKAAKKNPGNRIRGSGKRVSKGPNKGKFAKKN